MPSDAQSDSLSDIYSGIYDIVKKNLVHTGRSLSYSKEAFIALTVMPDCVFDYDKAKYLDNRSFFFVAYSRLFNVMPIKEVLDDWEGRITTIPQEEFRLLALKSLIGAPPAIACGSKIINYDIEKAELALLNPAKEIKFSENNYIMIEGFHPQDSVGRWSLGTCKIKCKLPWVADTYYIKVHAEPYAHIKYINVYNSGEKIKTCDIVLPCDSFKFKINYSGDGNILDLQFEIHEACCPAEVDINSNDTRTLGVWFKKLEFLTAEEYEETTVDTNSKAPPCKH